MDIWKKRILNNKFNYKRFPKTDKQIKIEKLRRLLIKKSLIDI